MKSTGNIDKVIACNQCGGRFTVRQLIMAADKCYRWLDVVRSKTLCCQSVEELWLKDGLASRGYVYAAGQAHFADMEPYQAPDLAVAYTSEQVSISLDGYSKTINRK
jgi:hypothetical protein